MSVLFISFYLFRILMYIVNSYLCIFGLKSLTLLLFSFFFFLTFKEEVFLQIVKKNVNKFVYERKMLNNFYTTKNCLWKWLVFAYLKYFAGHLINEQNVTIFDDVTHRDRTTRSLTGLQMVMADDSKPGRRDVCDNIDHWAIRISPAVFVVANFYLLARNNHFFVSDQNGEPIF